MGHRWQKTSTHPMVKLGQQKSPHGASMSAPTRLAAHRRQFLGNGCDYIKSDAWLAAICLCQCPRIGINRVRVNMVLLGFQLLFVFCMCYAVVSDFRELLIPNWIIVTLIAAFPPFAILYLEPLAVVWHVLIALAILALTTAFFAVKWIGGRCQAHDRSRALDRSKARCDFLVVDVHHRLCSRNRPSGPEDARHSCHPVVTGQSAAQTAASPRARGPMSVWGSHRYSRARRCPSHLSTVGIASMGKASILAVVSQILPLHIGSLQPRQLAFK